jgi:hypothetical protein
MKSAIIPAIVLAILFSCNNASSPGKDKEGEDSKGRNNDQVPAGLSTYTNRAENFELNYPEGWDTTRLSNKVIFMAAADTNAKKLPFRPNLNIYEVPNEEGYSLDSLISSGLNALRAAYPSARILEEGKRTSSQGLPYGLIRLTLPAAGLQVRSTSVYFPKDRIIYVMAFAEDDAAAANDSLFKKIIDRFHFLH